MPNKTKLILFFRDTHDAYRVVRAPAAFGDAQNLKLGWIFHLLSPQIGMDLEAVVSAVNKYQSQYPDYLDRIIPPEEVLMALHELAQRGYVHIEERYLAYNSKLYLRREEWGT